MVEEEQQRYNIIIQIRCYWPHSKAKRKSLLRMGAFNVVVTGMVVCGGSCGGIEAHGAAAVQQTAGQQRNALGDSSRLNLIYEGWNRCRLGE